MRLGGGLENSGDIVKRSCACEAGVISPAPSKARFVFETTYCEPNRPGACGGERIRNVCTADVKRICEAQEKVEVKRSPSSFRP